MGLTIVIIGLVLIVTAMVLYANEFNRKIVEYKNHIRQLEDKINDQSWAILSLREDKGEYLEELDILKTRVSQIEDKNERLKSLL